MNNSLDKLTIKGFNSIQNLENFDLNKLNVFIGANGAGKSNLLAFFKLLQNIMENKLATYITTLAVVLIIYYSMVVKRLHRWILRLSLAKEDIAFRLLKPLMEIFH